MSTALPIEFTSDIDDIRPLPRAFDASGGEGTISLCGAMSLGSRGWRLWAQAVRYRHRITCYVHARHDERTTPLDLENHTYSAVVRDVKPGNYEVRITHVLSDPLLPEGPTFLSSFETRVHVR